MSKKSLFIGDFKVRKCTQYGEYEIIDVLYAGEEIKLEFDTNENVIVVTAKNVVDGFDENTRRRKRSCDDWSAIGELEIPEQIRNVLVPLLLAGHKDDLFDCNMNPFDRKVAINERLQVSVWAKPKSN